MTIPLVFRYGAISQRIRIAHSLPGRLRLTVPGLAILHDGYSAYELTARGLLETLPGIKTVSLNHVTRNVLFSYDTAIISESMLIDWLEELFEASVKKIIELKTERSMQVKLRKLQNHIRRRIDQIRKAHGTTNQT